MMSFEIGTRIMDKKTGRAGVVIAKARPNMACIKYDEPKNSDCIFNLNYFLPYKYDNTRAYGYVYLKNIVYLEGKDAFFAQANQYTKGEYNEKD